MLVFTDGTINSLEGILEVFGEFANTSGLKISLEKSTIYLAGHSTTSKEQIFNQFAFSEGVFPVKYLGLPLSPKKLSIADCRPLLDRLKEKISSWTARFLSYAGRFQLISSVLSGITNYWLAAYCIPKKCLQEINSLLSAFLWSGPDLNHRKSKIAWMDVCVPKKEGGLGLRNLIETSKVSYLKLIWRIISRQPSLWVSWIWEKNIKKESFWSIKDSTSVGSWVWKKLLQLRPQAKSFYKHQVGNGKYISFWFDKWSNLGCLYDLMGSRGIIDLGIQRTATLYDAILHHQPRRQRNNILNQVEDKLRILVAQFPANNAEDQILWKHSGTKYRSSFSTKCTWIYSREQRLTVVWHKLLWFPHATPKYSFCSWLAFQDRLSTKDRMQAWNIGGCNRCLLCNRFDETRNHLFFKCDYSKRLWRSTMGSLMGSDFTSNWDQIPEAILKYQGSKIRFFLICYGFQTTIYHIWRERNNRNHGQQHIQSRFMAKIIDKAIRNNISAIQRLGDSSLSTGMVTWFSTRL